jgi:hypothetical protein
MQYARWDIVRTQWKNNKRNKCYLYNGIALTEGKKDLSLSSKAKKKERTHVG